MNWHKVDSVLGQRWELRGDERILAQVWRVRADVYWKLGVFGSARRAPSLSAAMQAAEHAVIQGDAA